MYFSSSFDMRRSCSGSRFTMINQEMNHIQPMTPIAQLTKATIVANLRLFDALQSAYQKRRRYFPKQNWMPIFR